MSVPHAEGERDAIIIPFPLHRVNTAEPVTEVTVAAPDEAHGSGEPQLASPDKRQRRAHNVALHALAGRGQSRVEIENRLRSKDLSSEVIAQEVSSLEAVGYVNDENLAAELVEKYGVRMGFGRRAVAEKLRARHLAPEVIENALGALSDEDESEALLTLARSKARSLSSLEPVVAKRRLAGVLLRKGFNPGDVYRVVAEVLP